MTRIDDDLAFLLKFENVAWYHNGKVRILDRRIYPIEIKYVECTVYQEVVGAIKDMVTQSGGPYIAAGMGMALAAYNGKDKGKKEFISFLQKAAYDLSHARPTTSKKMEVVVNECLKIAIDSIENGNNPVEAVFNHNLLAMEKRYKRSENIAKHLVPLFPQKGTVMTQCFAETIVGMFLKVARQEGKEIKLICPETRPYFQGARLTASVAYDQGYDVTVITDNMPGFVLKKKNVDLFTSAADVICMDGSVVNKIGTFQIALLANYWNIPYYATGIPNIAHATIDTVQIEERDPDFVLHALGRKITMDGVTGYYPAFDITPPALVTGIVTDIGIYTPKNLKEYFQN